MTAFVGNASQFDGFLVNCNRSRRGRWGLARSRPRREENVTGRPALKCASRARIWPNLLFS